MTFKSILLRALLAIGIIFNGLYLKAQPTFTTAYFPKTGTNYTKIFCQTNNVKPGLGGGSAVWDFSGLLPRQSNPTYTVEVVEASVTPLFPLFQQSNVAYKYDDTTSIYLNTTKGRHNKSGEATPGAIIDYTETYDVGPIPIKYSGLATDTYRGVIRFFNGTRGTRTGKIDIVNDGYGTINTPLINIDNNVIRLRIIELYTDSIFVKPKTIIRTVRDTTYQWYGGKYTMPILEYKSGIIIETQKPNRSYKTVWYLRDTNSGSTTSVLDPKSSEQVTLSPNPVNTVLMVQIPSTIHDISTSLEVCDMTGRAIPSISAAPQYGTGQGSTQMVYYSIPTTTLPSGTYYVRIRSKQGVIQKQFTVLH